nr:hypothetical protein [Tanacetum cinerariifolium]
MCELACQIVPKKQEEKRIEEEQAAKARYWKIPACCDDDDDYDFAITPVLSTEEPIDSLSMGDEHLDTIPTTESDEVIKSSVEDLVPIPSEFEGIPDTMCDVHFDNNHTPLEAKDHVEIVMISNDDNSSSDDDSLHEENIEYVEASPHDSELVSLEAAEIVILEVEEIEDDNLREKLLNVHLLIANIEALKDNPTQSSELLTKSSSTSLNSFLEETNTFHNSLPEFENFYFNLGEISSGSTTTHSDISLPEYEAFYFDDDHIKEISSGSTTTHFDISFSEYDSFIFDLTHKEFVDELTHIISPPEYDCFYFKDLPNPGELMSVLNSRIRENLSTTLVNLPIENYHSPLLAYVGKSKDTTCVSETRNPLSQKLENKNVELEFQVLNYARENAHLKATYKNLFDSMSLSRAQTKTIIASLQNELQSNIYRNAKLRTQLFKKVSDQKDNIQDTSKNTKFAKQPIVENLSKVGKTNALSNPVTSNLVSTPQESKRVNNDKVIALGMFRINPSKTSR